MAVIKINRKNEKELWFKMPRRSDPDLDALYYGRMGEFSPWADIAFGKHLKQLDRSKKYFADRNGDRLKMIRNNNQLWY